MRYTTSIPALVLMLAVSIIVGVESTKPPDSPEQELRAAEIAFAKTLADRDHAGFVGFLSEEAVFFAGDKELRGRDAVVAAWKPLFEGADAPFSWAPDVVAVLDSGRLGLTSGAVRDPEGNRIATFNSIWRRTDEGTWKIVFDRGCPPCKCP
jgi:ketosteroid isomerase-like protein